MEFLVGSDGVVSFLEVNTRLQVEHPVTEEVTGIDLVREQFRIADGEQLGYDDPPVRGHSFEFRINAEDPGRNFLPGPGTVTTFAPPSGPGVRLDAGVEAGSVIGTAWDSLLAKLVVTGATREQALRRAARALAEFTVEGLPTVLPFHRSVVVDPAFAPEVHGTAARFAVHTRWIETEFDNRIAPSVDPTSEQGGAERRATVVVEVGGRRLEVSVPSSLRASADPPSSGGGARARRGPAKKVPLASGAALNSPMQGTVVKVAVEDGQQVAEGDLVVVMEAMKMEQPLHAHRSGTVTGLAAQVGASVSSGAIICEIKGPGIPGGPTP